jgi:hypothetical protein
MRAAKLRPVGARPEDVDYRARRGLDKALFQSLLTGLLTGRWITEKRGLIITGPVESARPGLQDLTWLCSGASGLSRRRNRGLQTDATPVRRTGTGPW